MPVKVVLLLPDPFRGAYYQNVMHYSAYRGMSPIHFQCFELRQYRSKSMAEMGMESDPDSEF